MTVQERKFTLTQENKIGEWIYEQLTTDLVAETQGWAFELAHRVALRLNQQRVNLPALEPVVIWIPLLCCFPQDIGGIYQFPKCLLQILFLFPPL